MPDINISPRSAHSSHQLLGLSRAGTRAHAEFLTYIETLESPGKEDLYCRPDASEAEVKRQYVLGT